MSLIDNEQTKLLANALDRASTACFTVGILSPLARYVYGVVDLGPAIIQRWPIFSVFAWLAVSVALHLWARRIPKCLKS